ncbi:unnamed protein product [Cylindrotheca closterium]|uniref:CRAL-TRIO domain-containing protein n=1 Tax=Cylindrotheca closterium TaxID=2856 RepID=A0AAD2GBJ7_9STRA|nr:unnamed protein product [Cylindrotheca closterium]
MLFTINRSNDCPFKRSFNKLMNKYKVVDHQQVKRLSNGTDDDYSVATEDFSSTGDFTAGSSQLLNVCEEDCMVGLRQYVAQIEGIQMSEQRLFRFANFHNFDLEKAKDAVDENRDNAFLDLEMHGELKGQFVNKMLFPLTGLRTKKNNSQVIYGRPSRGNPEDDNMTKVLESLCYVMNDFSQTEQQCRDGVAIVSNLEGFTHEHFDELEWRQFMLALQGTLVPTKVTSILMVNPPSWFKQDIWKKMRSSLPFHLRRNVHIISSNDKLGDYLMEDYQAYLPHEVAQGYRSVSEIIEDYIDLKSYEDRQKRAEIS